MLVFNYVRNVVLRFAATMVRHPRPKVPIPVDDDQLASRRANSRERFLLAIWNEFKKAWRDVELNASKCAYGVLRVIWDPPEPTSVELGMGDDVRTEQRYTSCPFDFRSIKPEHFYPVYRSFKDPNDFLYVMHVEPNRLVTDLELKYGVLLQGTGMDVEGDMVGTEPSCEVIAYWDEKRYALVAVTRVLEVKADPRGRGPRNRPELIETERYALLEWIDDHGFDRVPFWVLQNIRNPGYDPTVEGSIADIDDIAGLNRHYNWIVSEEADEISVHIHRPTIYASDNHAQQPQDIKFEPGAVIPTGHDEDIYTPDWDPAPGFVAGHLDRVESAMKELSFLSEAGFGNLPSGTSGIAAKVALTPLDQIIELKLPQRKDALESICSFILKVFEKYAENTKFQGWVLEAMGRYGMTTLTKEDVRGHYFVAIDYGNMLPRDDLAYEQNETYKYKTGTQSLTDTLDNLGEDDPRAAMDRIKRELMDPELNPEHVIRVVEAKEALQRLQQPPPAPEGTEEGAAGAATTPMGAPQVPGTAQPGTRALTPGGPLAQEPPVPAGEAFRAAASRGTPGRVACCVN